MATPTRWRLLSLLFERSVVCFGFCRAKLSRWFQYLNSIPASESSRVSRSGGRPCIRARRPLALFICTGHGLAPRCVPPKLASRPSVRYRRRRPTNEVAAVAAVDPRGSRDRVALGLESSRFARGRIDARRGVATARSSQKRPCADPTRSSRLSTGGCYIRSHGDPPRQAQDREARTLPFRRYQSDRKVTVKVRARAGSRALRLRVSDARAETITMCAARVERRDAGLAPRRRRRVPALGAFRRARAVVVGCRIC